MDTLDLLASFNKKPKRAPTSAPLDLLAQPKRTSTLPDLSPDEQDSLLRGIANKSLGAASAVGNVLDTVRGATWDALQGKNPLPGVFNPTERTSGTDLINGKGINHPGISDDLMGFAAEVLGDPAIPQKLAALFHANPERTFHREELAKMFSVPVGRISDSLIRLKKHKFAESRGHGMSGAYRGGDTAMGTDDDTEDD
jgi:hypothetical protein